LARQRRLPTDSGLVVVGIDQGGPAHRIGLRLLDVIFQADQYYVEDLDALGIILEDVRPGQTIRLGVARGSVAALVRIRARREPTKARPRPETAEKGEAI
jgi:S1-C subfamily serine protease